MKATHLIIHCSDTGAEQKFTHKDIISWHLAPKDIYEGKLYKGVRYKGHTYTSRMNLPVENINGLPIFNLKGNGWTVPGYRDVIERSGEVVNIVPYNDDDNLDPWEITNGVGGENSHTIHVCLMGGSQRGEPEYNFTERQELALEKYIKKVIADHPWILVAGHNQFDAAKPCPSFNVSKWMEKRGFDKKNIEYKNFKNNKFYETKI